MNVVLYTSVFDDYDAPPKHTLIDGIDYVPVTELRLISNSATRNRYVKMRPHLIPRIQDYEISVYADTNMDLILPDRLLELCLMLKDSDKSAIFFKHPQRTHAYSEALACMRQGVGSVDLLHHYRKFKEEGFNDDVGLTENNVIIRKHNDINLKLCEDIWFRTYKDGCKRDQVSLPYARWKTRYTNFFLLEQKVKEEIFKWRPHNASRIVHNV